jgi:anti-sigma factor RsiW
MITRENYEEYFLLYVDNELPAAARLAVEKFVADNPDLQEDLDTLLQCRVHPDHHAVFPGKEALFQQDLLSYVDGELDAAGRVAVEEFVGQHPSKAEELRQLFMTVSRPDESIVFPDKESLYRSERRKLVFLPWMKAGIAAAVLGLVALLLLMTHHKETPVIVQNPRVNKNTPVVVTPATPAPLYSTGIDDQIAASDRPRRNQQRKAPTQVPVEKVAQVAGQQQDVVRATTAPTPMDNRDSDPAAVTTVMPDVPEKTLIKPAITVAAVNIPKEQSSFATQALLEEAEADGSKDVAAAAPAGKSKLRGLFRKVSRTLGKTADRDDDGQKEVLISAFQVALK